LARVAAGSKPKRKPRAKGKAKPRARGAGKEETPDTGRDLNFDPGRLRSARRWRRAGLAFLLILLGLGVAGVFDQAEDDVSASAGSVDLRVSYPDRVRAGLESSLDITVENPAGLTAPVELAVSREWIEMFDLGAIEPAPDAETGDPERLIWTFEPPPGDRLEVSVALTLRPAVRTGEEGQVVLLSGDAPFATVDFDTSVVP
jgi:hypothetical protein